MNKLWGNDRSLLAEPTSPELRDRAPAGPLGAAEGHEGFLQRQFTAFHAFDERFQFPQSAFKVEYSRFSRHREPSPFLSRIR